MEEALFQSTEDKTGGIEDEFAGKNITFFFSRSLFEKI